MSKADWNERFEEVANFMKENKRKPKNSDGEIYTWFLKLRKDMNIRKEYK